MQESSETASSQSLTEQHSQHEKRQKPSKKIYRNKKVILPLGIILIIAILIFVFLQPALYINQNEIACGITVLQNKYSGELKPDNRSCYCFGKKHTLQQNNIGVDQVDYCDGIGISTLNLSNSETE